MPAQINVYDTTATTITVRLIGLDTSYSGPTRTCYWKLSGNGKNISDEVQFGNGTSDGAYYIFKELSPGKTYTISAEAKWYTGTTESSVKFQSVQASTNELPPTFRWYTTIKPGEPLYVYATDWVELTKDINKLREYRGNSPLPFRLGSNVVSGNDITVDIYNEVARELGATPVDNNTIIEAEHFNVLARLYNNAVASLT